MTTRENFFYSRGNTAIGALVMITVVGIGTVLFDATQSTNTGRQVAAASEATAMPTDRGACIVANGAWNCEKDAQNKKCSVGEDYLIKLQDAVDPTTKRIKKAALLYTTKDGKRVDPANQCIDPKGVRIAYTIESVKYNDVQIPRRSCSAAGWKCYVTFCKPKGFSGDALTQEECITIPNPASVGGEVSAQKAMDSSGFTSDIQKITANGTVEEKAALSAYLAPTGASAQSGVLNSFDISNQKEVVQDRLLQRDIATTNYDECMSGVIWSAVSGCRAEREALTEAELKVKAEQERLADYTRNAQLLSNSQTGLTPGSNSIEEELKKPCPFPSTEFGCYGNTSVPAKESNTFQNCPGGPNCPGGTWNPNKGQLEGSGAGNQPSPSPAPRASSGSGFNLGQIMPLLSSALKLFQGTQTAAQPSCKLTVTPANVEAGKPATLSWTTENSQAAYLSNQGQVGPSGSIQIQPQYSTTYSMQVTGYPQQAQQQQQPYNPYTNPYGQQQQGQYVWNPYLGEYTYVQAPPQQYGQPNGQAYSSQPAQPAGPPPQAQCSTQVTVGAASATTTAAKPKAQISCQPRLADVGMQVALSFACQNSAASVGRGFSTGGQLSGSASAVVEKPALGTRAVTYGLTCSKDGQMDSAECTVEIHRSSVVLVANPKVIQPGETTNVGWVTSGMESCTISSSDLQPFTEANENNFSTGGTAKTPVLGQNTKFVLTCTTKAGGTKIAETEVVVGR